MKYARLLTLYVIILFLATIVVLSQAVEHKWLILFDGSNVDAWRGFKRSNFPHGGWIIENESLKTIPDGDRKERVDIITKEKFNDFELELEWKVSEAGNSGVFYLVSEEETSVWANAPELQVLDDKKHRDGSHQRTSAGSLYDLIAPKGKKLNPVGEFNHTKIIKNGNHVEHWLNGNKIVEYELGSKRLQILLAESKFRNMPNFAKRQIGHIALQHHGEEVWYRNIRIKKIN